MGEIQAIKGEFFAMQTILTPPSAQSLTGSVCLRSAWTGHRTTLQGRHCGVHHDLDFTLTVAPTRHPDFGCDI